MKLIKALLLSLIALTPQLIKAQKTTIKNIDERLEVLLAKMTIDEKIGQLNQVVGDISTGTSIGTSDLLNQIKDGKVGSVLSHTNFENKITMQRTAVKESRLGIPLVFGFDVIHGYKTIFPIPLAQAASWDLGLIERIERIAATEAAADGQDWTFAPMVDITRDPRWGRVMEGAGEDPYLSSKIAAARVRGFQGTDLSKPNAVAACVKHFAAYGFSEGGRDYNTVDMSDHRLREIVLPPFEAAAKEGAATFMNAFNTLNGTPASMNHYLLKDILRQEWGFKGMVVSDWNSIGETITHGAAADEVDAAAKCLSAGSDMDMAGTTFQKGLKIALINGKVTQKQLDDAVRNVLRLKFQLGLFDDPFRRLNPANRKNNLENPSYRQTAREAAQKSMVLLRNNGGILPLTSQTPLKRILIVGPFADNNSQKDYLSFWTLGLGTPHYDSTKIITPAQALKPALEAQGFEVTIRAICKDAACTEIEMDAAVKDVRTADVVIICVGEHGLDCGESRSVADINLRNAQEQLIKRMTRTNKPAIMVLFNSRPLTFDWAFENMQGILVAWQPGFETGNALADIITGKVNPSGKLPMTFPKHVGQIPLYYNALKTGRPQSNFGTPWTSGYLDMPSTPAFPFGYGIGYSRFVYSEVKLSTNAITQNESLDVSVNVTNTGSMDGEEVVQLYINDPVADVARPVKELKGFQKIFLPAGKSQIVHFKITKDELAYWNDKKEKKADPGTFTVFIGGNSQEVKSASFELK